MAFWLRAGLVICVIYYLSPLRLGEAPAPARTAQAAPAFGEIAGPVLDAMPGDLRARMAEAAAAEAGRALGAGLRTAMEAGRSPSRDTLTTHDRQPAWRGAAERDTR
ncbi:hypothetical protein [Methylobacterium frigidaeris]|uniref:Uncharacterized protein n=1 Tax=Methylobacterium frigidaeris TaxID=2038277 RepID=A0AA37H8U8_9HYPH|nr:hypothetical protein [Methylobacterium frigidaeris]PIK70747.1 hypothetical protein CS379_23040 [Methylobacterium frigidaeris]GJD61460.1 hypothetical protein MPEAHAMD_1603 [Methylobacterium frigidaeris]